MNISTDADTVAVSKAHGDLHISWLCNPVHFGKRNFGSARSSPQCSGTARASTTCRRYKSRYPYNMSQVSSYLQNVFDHAGQQNSTCSKPTAIQLCVLALVLPPDGSNCCQSIFVKLQQQTPRHTVLSTNCIPVVRNLITLSM